MLRSNRFCLPLAAVAAGLCMHSAWAGGTPTGAVTGPFHYVDGSTDVDLYIIGDPGPDSWTAMEEQAVDDGGFLATVHDSAENSFIVDNMLTGAFSDVPVWIGYYDPTFDLGGGSHASNFVWADGSTSSYTNWNTDTGEPNDDGSTGGGGADGFENPTSGSLNGEFYAALNWHWSRNDGEELGTWNDTPELGTTGYGGNSNGPYYGILEINASAPLPSSLSLALSGIGTAGLLALSRRRRTLAR